MGVVDTIITFDPETYEENVIIYKRGPYEFKDIRGFKINQYWIWDDKLKTLKSVPTSISPLAQKEKELFLYNLKLSDF